MKSLLFFPLVRELAIADQHGIIFNHSGQLSPLVTAGRERSTSAVL
jgi:hypothetical protein